MWKWIAGIFGAIAAAFAAVLVALRLRRDTRTLADDAISLSERERKRVREQAERSLDTATRDAVDAFNSKQRIILDRARSCDVDTLLYILRERDKQ